MRVRFRTRAEVTMLPSIGIVHFQATTPRGYWSNWIEAEISSLESLRPFEHLDPEHPARERMPGKIAYLEAVAVGKAVPPSLDEPGSLFDEETPTTDEHPVPKKKRSHHKK